MWNVIIGLIITNIVLIMFYFLFMVPKRENRHYYSLLKKILTPPVFITSLCSFYFKVLFSIPGISFFFSILTAQLLFDIIIGYDLPLPFICILLSIVGFICLRFSHQKVIQLTLLFSITCLYVLFLAQIYDLFGLYKVLLMVFLYNSSFVLLRADFNKIRVRYRVAFLFMLFILCIYVHHHIPIHTIWGIRYMNLNADGSITISPDRFNPEEPRILYKGQGFTSSDNEFHNYYNYQGVLQGFLMFDVEHNWRFPGEVTYHQFNNRILIKPYSEK